MTAFRDTLATVVLLLSLFAAGMWGFVLSSDQFFDPVSIRVKGDYVLFERITPRGPVRARWSDDVIWLSPAGAEQVCDTHGHSTYDGSRGVVSIPIDQWFPWGCDVSRAATYFVRSEWQVLLFGTIPLRPVSFEWRFER